MHPINLFMQHFRFRMASTPLCRSSRPGVPIETTIHDNIAFGDTSLLESDSDNLITEEAKAFGVDNFIDLSTFYGDDTRSKDISNGE
jgi:hypothetical protein